MHHHFLHLLVLAVVQHGGSHNDYNSMKAALERDVQIWIFKASFYFFMHVCMCVCESE